MENKKAFYNSALKSGLIIGAVSIVVFILMYVADIKPVGIMMPIVIMLVGLAISIGVLVYLFKSYKTQIGGYITFGDAFLYCFIALLAATVLSSLFTFLFIQFIEPNYYMNIMEAQKTYMENYLSGKVTEEQLVQTLDKMDAEAAKMTPVSNLIKGLVGGVIFDGIIALIVGAIMKKKPEMFDSSSTGGVI
jgi:Protein of unknown function (DUF4199)